MKKKASQPASPQPRRPTHAALTFSKPQIFEPVPTADFVCSVQRRQCPVKKDEHHKRGGDGDGNGRGRSGAG